MRPSVILGVGSVLVLLGAYFGSKLLVSDVPTPSASVATVVSPPPDVTQPVSPPPAPRPGARSPEAMIAERQGPLRPVVASPGYPRLAEGNTAPLAADVPASPFQGESKELDYAEALLAEPTPDPARLRSAHEVLTRCVEQEPANRRCQDDLALARQRLFPLPPSQREAGNPTLQTEPPHLIRPGLQPK